MRHLRQSGRVDILQIQPYANLLALRDTKSNHSLCATSTSSTYHSGINEQRVTEHTEHHNLEGVRSYKTTLNTQHERSMSDIMNGTSITRPAQARAPSQMPTALAKIMNSSGSQ